MIIETTGIPFYKLIPIFWPPQNPRRGWHDYRKVGKAGSRKSIANHTQEFYSSTGIPFYKLIPIFWPPQNPRRGWHDYRNVSKADSRQSI